MKKSELFAGTSYYISNDPRWEESGKGYNAVYTGTTSGFRAEVRTPSAGPDDDGLDVVMFVHIRCTTEDADILLEDVRAAQNDLELKRARNYKRGLVLDLGPITTTQIGVTLTHDQFDKLARLAKAGKDAQK